MKHETTSTFELDSGEEVRATIRLYPGDPGRMYMRNGDPGYPPEPAEVEIFDYSCNGKPFEPTDKQTEKWETCVLENPEAYFDFG